MEIKCTSRDYRRGGLDMAKDIQERLRDKYAELELRDVNSRLVEANKGKTIKSSTDDELKSLLRRLEDESRAQELIRRLKRNSMSEVERFTADLSISTETPVEDMYHYGILGMRWGKRKGTSTSTTTKLSKDAKEKQNLKKKKVSEMTNDELRKLNTRMQLEKQYKELTPTTKGRKIVTDLLVGAAKQTAQTYIQKYASKKIESIINPT